MKGQASKKTVSAQLKNKPDQRTRNQADTYNEPYPRLNSKSTDKSRSAQLQAMAEAQLRLIYAFRDGDQVKWEDAQLHTFGQSPNEDFSALLPHSAQNDFDLESYVAELMRMAAGLKPEKQGADSIIIQVRNGVKRSQIDEVAALAGLTDKEMAPVLNMSIRTLHQKKANDQLPADSAERLLLFEGLLRHGLHVFDGNKNQLNTWLHTPLRELAIREQPLPQEDILPTRSMGSFDGPYDLTLRSDQDRKRTEQVPVPSPQTPLQVLDTYSGFKLANNVLGRIETGVYS